MVSTATPSLLCLAHYITCRRLITKCLRSLFQRISTLPEVNDARLFRQNVRARKITKDSRSPPGVWLLAAVVLFSRSEARWMRRLNNNGIWYSLFLRFSHCVNNTSTSKSTAHSGLKQNISFIFFGFFLLLRVFFGGLRCSADKWLTVFLGIQFLFIVCSINRCRSAVQLCGVYCHGVICSAEVSVLFNPRAQNIKTRNLFRDHSYCETWY